MPSLARKSMNFMRDVYALAANSDRAPNSSAPPRNPQPSTGLSSQFTQGNQSHFNPPSPYLQHSSSQGQSLAPNLPTVSTPYLSPSSDPQQPYGPWSPALEPLAPLPSRPQLNTTSRFSNPATPSPDSSRPFSQSPLSASASPQSYGFNPTNSHYQQLPERPPLPARPSLTSSRPHSQSFSAWAPHAGSQSLTPETLVAAPPFTPVHSSSVPQLANGYGSQDDDSLGPAELWSPPPPPPPLPRRPHTQLPSSVCEMPAAPPPSNLSTLAVSAPASTTISYKVPSAPLHSPASIPQIQQDNGSHGPLELHSEYVPRPLEHTTQPFDSSNYPQTHGPAIDVFELVGSPVSYLTSPSESSAEHRVSATVVHPAFSSAATLSRQSVLPQGAGHHPPSIHHNSSSAVSPPRQFASPQVAVYQSSAAQYHSGLSASHSAQLASLPVAANHSSSIQHTPFYVHEMPAAVDVPDLRTAISWPSSSAPASELP